MAKGPEAAYVYGMHSDEANPTGLTPPPRLPVAVITGFLGSGKTTLLRRLLQRPDMGDTAVIINEFGEVGLDHALVEHADEDMVVLNSGCLCCTVHGDLVNTLRGMFLKRVRGEVPPFARVVVETTGLADPAPIIHTLMSDPLLSDRFRLDAIVATVDAVNGDATLDNHPESVKQAAVADRLLITKTDMPEAGDVAPLEARLRALNPAAALYRTVDGNIDPGRLFGAALFDPAKKTADVRGWLREEAYRGGGREHGHGSHHPHDVNRHDDRIRAFCITLDEPLDWDKVAVWLDFLAAYRGNDLLRIKGILNVRGTERPVAIHGVQHLFHAPAMLDAWPDDEPEGERCSRIVFITRDVSRETIEQSLSALGVKAGAPKTAGEAAE